MISSTQTNQPFAPGNGAEKFLNHAIDTLQQAGCRITSPRIKLLRALSERDAPLTVEELHHQVGGRSTCDLVTIYRCMAAFEELGLISRTYLHSGTALYEKCVDGQKLYRIVCKITDQVAALDPDLAGPIRALLDQAEEHLRAKGYRQVSHVLEFFVVGPNVDNRVHGKPTMIQNL